MTPIVILKSDMLKNNLDQNNIPSLDFLTLANISLESVIPSVGSPSVRNTIIGARSPSSYSFCSSDIPSSTARFIFVPEVKTKRILVIGLCDMIYEITTKT